jgi:hypothetical protein
MSILNQLVNALEQDEFWRTHLEMYFRGQEPSRTIHIGIFHEPFLGWVLDGRKTVESRFSQNQVAPYAAVEQGDILLLKRVAGPVVGICHINASWSYRLDPKTWELLKDGFAEAICAQDESFWEDRESARFATLMSLDQVRPLAPIEYEKSDRRGWVVDSPKMTQMSLGI